MSVIWALLISLATCFGGVKGADRDKLTDIDYFYFTNIYLHENETGEFRHFNFTPKANLLPNTYWTYEKDDIHKWLGLGQLKYYPLEICKKPWKVVFAFENGRSLFFTPGLMTRVTPFLQDNLVFYVKSTPEIELEDYLYIFQSILLCQSWYFGLLVMSFVYGVVPGVAIYHILQRFYMAKAESVFLFCVRHVIYFWTSIKRHGFMWAGPRFRKYVKHTANVFEMPYCFRLTPNEVVPEAMFEPSESESGYYPHGIIAFEDSTTTLDGFTSYSSDDGFII